VTDRTALTRSTSSPSRPPSFSFSRLKPRPAIFSVRRAMSSRVAEPDRPRGRRSGAPEAEQLVDRLPRQLALEVVEGVVDRSARRLLTRREAVGDLVEPKRIVAEIDAVEPVER